MSLADIVPVILATQFTPEQDERERKRKLRAAWRERNRGAIRKYARAWRAGRKRNG
jgi:hypothetical protein